MTTANPRSLSSDIAVDETPLEEERLDLADAEGADPEDLSRLLARIADDDLEEAETNQPSVPTSTEGSIAPAASNPDRIGCPAGIPQPKINFAALQKSKAQREGEKDRPSLSDVLATPEGPQENLPPPIPKWLLALDQVTSRISAVEPRLPLYLGTFGLCLLGNGILILVMAALGWI